MTQAQAPGSNLLVARLLLWVPAGIGALLALAVLALGSIPLYSQLALQGRQVEEKQAQEERLPQLRSELLQLSTQQQQAERQQQQLISLIAGSGELGTFMAQADREARRHGVQLQLYEPTAALAGAAPEQVDGLKGQAKGTRKDLEKQAKADQEASAAAKADPMQRAGLQSTKLLLSAKGRYPNLLAFLRALEALSLLVVQSNLNLSEGKPDPAATGGQQSQTGQATAPIELKLAVALYNAKTKN